MLKWVCFQVALDTTTCMYTGMGLVMPCGLGTAMQWADVISQIEVHFFIVLLYDMWCKDLYIKHIELFLCFLFHVPYLILMNSSGAMNNWTCRKGKEFNQKVCFKMHYMKLLAYIL